MTAITAPAGMATRRQATAAGMLTGTSSRWVGWIVSILVLIAVCALSLGLGSAQLDVGSVIGALVHPDGSMPQRIVMELRMPRTALGLAVGMALGLAGVLMQGLTRNPLAEPGILGISSGASLAVVLSIAILDTADPGRYVWIAIGGAAIAAAIVHLLGTQRHGRTDPVRLILAGAVVAALLEACISSVLVMDKSTLDQYRFWLVGSISGRGLDTLAAVLPVMLVGGVLALLSGRALNSLSMGDDVARSLGQRVTRTRLIGSAGVVLLAGSAVALAGPIVFVGLAVPHAARMLVGPDYRWILAYSLVLGPALLLVADILGRVVMRPGEIAVGIMTALIGAPILILLVRRQRLNEA